jgi:hypothetical protein
VDDPPGIKRLIRIRRRAVCITPPALRARRKIHKVLPRELIYALDAVRFTGSIILSRHRRNEFKRAAIAIGDGSENVQVLAVGEVIQKGQEYHA